MLDLQHERRYCPAVMCPDDQIQDPKTCQCRPIAKNVPPELVKDLNRFGDLLTELCNTVPQLMHPQVCQGKRQFQA